MTKKGFVLWFTGLPCAGKTTIADQVHKELKARKIPVQRLDGDVVRATLNKDLGMSQKDRDANIERVAFVAKLLSDNGVNVIAAFVSPYHHHRECVKNCVKKYIEVFVNAPIEVCESRDAKGMYKLARANKIKMFTGISDKYDAPTRPHIEIRTDQLTIKQSVDKVIEYLSKRKLI